MNAAHLDYEALADLAEGLLDDEQTTSANAHLAGCAECRSHADEVADVSRLLAETPTPQMPADLVSRLDAAIAAESHSTPSAHSRRRLRRFQLVAVAAGIVVVGGVGGTALTKAVTNHAAESGVASKARPVEERSNTAGPRAGSSTAYDVVTTGTKYTAADLTRQVAAALRQRTVSGQSTLAAPTGELAGCVSRIGGGRRPVLVDRGDYEGKPATIVAFAGGAQTTPDPANLDIWVVGPSCSADTSDVVQHAQVPG